MSETLRIDLLIDVPEAIPVLARCFVEEWAPYYGPAGAGDASRDLESCCNRDRLPIGLVARNTQGQIVGTAALKAQSMDSHRHLGPWLAALLVVPAHRRKRVATALVEAIEGEARRLGFDSLYCATSCLGGLLEDRGWEAVEDGVSSLRGPIALYRLNLGDICGPTTGPMRDG